MIFSASLIALLLGVFNPEPPKMFFKHSDKFEHFFAFCFVALVGAFCIKGRVKQSIYWALCMLMAYVLEYGQGNLLPKRTFDIYDVYANGAGVFSALLLWFLYIKAYKKM